METDPEAPGTPSEPVARAPASTRGAQPRRETAMGSQAAAVPVNNPPHEQGQTFFAASFCHPCYLG